MRPLPFTLNRGNNSMSKSTNPENKVTAETKLTPSFFKAMRAQLNPLLESLTRKYDEENQILKEQAAQKLRAVILKAPAAKLREIQLKQLDEYVNPYTEYGVELPTQTPRMKAYREVDKLHSRINAAELQTLAGNNTLAHELLQELTDKIHLNKED